MTIKRNTTIILSEEDKKKISAFSALMNEIQTEVVGTENPDDIIIDNIIEVIDKSLNNFNDYVEE